MAENSCGEKQAEKAPSRRPLLLDRYEKGMLLGAGSFACVYHGRHATTGEEVAIKVVEKSRIFKSEQQQQQRRDHVEREISVLRRVCHPHVVRLVEVMASKSRIYIVMEYVRGGDLSHKISAEGPLGEAAARKFFQQLISAVKFCHGRGVYHRDIKLENLLVDEHGDLKLSDFGLSAVAEQKRIAELLHTLCGSPAYIAPELIAHRTYDPARADVWSCGVVLFGLRAGHLPFQDMDVSVMSRKICKGELRYPNSFSPGLIRLLRRIFIPNPTKRITISEIVETPWFRKDFREAKPYHDKCRSFFDDARYALPPTPPPTPPRHDAPWEMKSECSSPTPQTSDPSFASSSTARRPRKLNAFDIISFSPWLDLSRLFDDGGRERWCTSSAEAPEIVSKLEEIAGSVGFAVRTRDFMVSIRGREEGDEEPLLIAAEVAELTPHIAVLVVRRKGGDEEKYAEFCNNTLSPGLQSLNGDTSSLEKCTNK